jgi:hypothetical protein
MLLPARDFIPAALALSLTFLFLLWRIGHLSRKSGVLFVALQLLVITVFICATPQAVGAHHAAMVFPFSHILVAVAVAELSRLSDVHLFGIISCKHVAIAAFVILLVVPQIAINVSYLKAFAEHGGVGIWSDAIYELARYAVSRPDRDYMLMDWGFSNQLLLLSGGAIRKEEVFVQVLDRGSDKERIAALEPYLMNRKNLFVFHVPGRDTFPVRDVFKRALDQKRLDVRTVKTFYQRDGQPIYLMYEVVDADTTSTNDAISGAYYYREMEDWDDKSGGALDYKDAASHEQALGQFWGNKRSDFAAYRLALPVRIPTAYLTVRYAFEADSAQHYHVFLDDNYVDTMALQATGGFGYTQDQWKLQHVRVGALETGVHELRLQPVMEGQTVNLDCFYLTSAKPWTKRVRPSIGTGLIQAPRRLIAIEIAPREILAGEDTLALRVFGLDVPAIDVLYSLAGKRMPPIHGWRLDANRSATLFVDPSTAKGIYRYLAIRDARDHSAESWIPVDVQVRVK